MIDMDLIKRTVAAVPAEILVGPVGGLSAYGKAAGLSGSSHRHFMSYCYRLRAVAVRREIEGAVAPRVKAGELFELGVKESMYRVTVTYAKRTKALSQSERAIDKHEHPARYVQPKPKASTVPQTERRAQRALEMTVLRQKAAEYDKLVAAAKAA